MKKRRMLCALCLLLGLMMLCSGCEKKESADDYPWPFDHSCQGK